MDIDKDRMEAIIQKGIDSVDPDNMSDEDKAIFAAVEKACEGASEEDMLRALGKMVLEYMEDEDRNNDI